jgi:hypothetical protein
MLNKDFFLNKLRSGESIDDIGTTIAALMNEAMDAYEAEKAIAAKKNDARKREIVVGITELLKEFAALEGADADDLDLTDKEIETMIDALSDLFKTITKLKKFKITTPVPSFLGNIKASPKAEMSDDEVLSNFIKDMFG